MTPPATLVSVAQALLHSPKLTASAVSLALALVLGPWSVDVFLGEYVDRWLDIQEQEAEVGDLLKPLALRVLALEADLASHVAQATERYEHLGDTMDLILLYTAPTPGGTP